MSHELFSDLLNLHIEEPRDSFNLEFFETSFHKHISPKCSDAVLHTWRLSSISLERKLVQDSGSCLNQSTTFQPIYISASGPISVVCAVREVSILSQLLFTLADSRFFFLFCKNKEFFIFSIKGYRPAISCVYASEVFYAYLPFWGSMPTRLAGNAGADSLIRPIKSCYGRPPTGISTLKTLYLH